MNNILKEVENFTLENKLIQKGDSILIMLSGGSDSVALTDILYKLKDKYNLTLYAYHLNHNIREDAKNDAKLSQNLANNLNIPFFYINFKVVEYAKKNKLTIEEAARKIRYHFAYRLANKLKCKKIATGHNLDDNIETFFLNLTRGAGLNGLKGIKEKNNKIIRPLLNIKKQELNQYCIAQNLKFAIDKTNQETIYKRNFIRHKIIKFLQKEFYDFKDRLKTTLYILNKENSFIQEYTDKILNKLIKINKKDFIYIKLDNTFLNQHIAIKLRIVKKILEFAKKQDLEFKNIKDLLNIIEKKNTAYFEIGNFKIEKSRDNLFIYKFAPSPFSQYKLNAFQLDTKDFNLIITEKPIKEIEYFNIKLPFSITQKEKIKNIQIRKRQKGDRITKNTKLKDYLIKRKIPNIVKDNLYIITYNKEIFAIPGIYKKENQKQNSLYLNFKYKNILKDIFLHLYI